MTYSAGAVISTTSSRRYLGALLIALALFLASGPRPARADFYSDGLRLVYQNISVDLPIQEGVTSGGQVQVPDLPVVAWHYPGMAWPGQGLRTMLYAHYRPGYFGSFPNARLNDGFTISRPDGHTLYYKVIAIYSAVPPTEVGWLEPGDHDQVVLETCSDWNNGPKQLIVGEPTNTLLSSAPRDVYARAVDHGAVVSWAPPLWVGYSPPVNYEISGGPNPVEVSGASQSVVVGGLTNGNTYTFTVTPKTQAGLGASATSNPVWPYPQPPGSVSYQSSYQLSSSQPDAASYWYEIDSSFRYSFTLAPGQVAVVGANIDLWTALAGFNQDIGIFETDCSLWNLVAWKEAGGFAGTYSPNAAFLQAVVGGAGSHKLTLCWKANKAGAPPNTIFAGAGTADTYFSPTSVTVKILPAAYVTSSVRNQSFTLGPAQPDRSSTWYEVDPGLRVNITAPADGEILLGANVDLWTALAGYNQDIGIFAGTDCQLDHMVAWKESGGFAGTYSPNAAYVEGSAHVAAGGSYKFTLCWKSNLPAPPNTIYAGAGTGDSYFSPTRLTAEFVPAGNLQAVARTGSFSLPYQQPDRASSWYEIDPSLRVLVGSSPVDRRAVLAANVDIWTGIAGYNQDVAIFVKQDGGTPELAAWKESGGFGGTYSPNAAYVQLPFLLLANHTYTFSLYWKVNRPAPPNTIYAGAGTADTYFSPTSLVVDLSG